MGIINTIHYFTEKNISISFIAQGLTTLGPDNKENPISKMMISILGIVGEMERAQIRERQHEGIRLAKLKKNVYLGRKPGSSESILDFLSKEKNKKAFELLKKGYKVGEVAKLADLHVNTVTKINKLVKQQ